MFNYDEYLKKQDSLSFEESLIIYNKIIGSNNTNDSIFNELWSDLVSNANSYVLIRNQWSTLSQEEKTLKDSSRTAQHNSLIATLSPLERYMKKNGWDTTWVDNLGGLSAENRKKIGDFAGYLLCIGSLKSR